MCGWRVVKTPINVHAITHFEAFVLIFTVLFTSFLLNADFIFKGSEYSLLNQADSSNHKKSYLIEHTMVKQIDI